MNSYQVIVRDLMLRAENLEQRMTEKLDERHMKRLSILSMMRSVIDDLYKLDLELEKWERP